MKLNSEQIKDALSCRSGNIIGCMNDECAYFHKDCNQSLYRDALYLIESQEQKISELTEENERLRANAKEMLEGI